MDDKKVWEHYLNLATTYHLLAKKYEFIDPELHHYYAMEFKRNLDCAEKHFLAMQQSKHMHHLMHHQTQMHYPQEQR